MEIILVLGVLSLFLFVFLIYKNRIMKINLLLFIAWWGLLLIVSLMDPFNLDKVSLKTYILIFIYIIMFVVGYTIPSLKKIQYKKNVSIDLSRFYKLIFIVHLFSFPIIIYYFIKYQTLLNTFGHTYARLIRYDLGYLFNNVLESAVYSYIVSPIMLISRILIAILLVKKQMKNFTFVLMLINVLLDSQIGLGRFGYFELLMFIFITYLFLKDKEENRRSRKRGKKGQIVTLTLISIGLITIMNYTLLKRKGIQEIDSTHIASGYSDLFEQAIAYFVGPFRALDHVVSQGKFEHLNLFYGRSTFSGAEQIVAIFLKQIDSGYKTAHQLINPILQDPISIGIDKSFNAFYTSIMNHYLDFNILGVIIIPFVFGLIVSNAILLYIKNQSIFSLALAVYLMYNSLVSSLKWNFQSILAWITVSILILSQLYFYQQNKYTSIKKEIIKFE